MANSANNDTNFKLYGLIVGLTITIMLTCDTLVYKSINIYNFKITASGIIFSFCYVLSTISTEVYGYKLGGRTIWIIVICQPVFILSICAASSIQSDSNQISQHYYALFNEFWKVMVGTWISVPASYFCNGFIVSKMKIFFNGKLFIVRYIFSAFMAQGILLLTSYPIILWNKYSAIDLANIILTTWAYKIVASVILLPVGIYLVNVVKKIEKTDYYDWNISYNPFHVFGEKTGEVSGNAYKQ